MTGRDGGRQRVVPTTTGGDHDTSAARLAIWATARVTRLGPGGQPWHLVDHAGNLLDRQAQIPDPAIADTVGAADDAHLSFTSRNAAQAFVEEQRRRAAWHVLAHQVAPPSGRTGDVVAERTTALFRSLNPQRAGRRQSPMTTTRTQGEAPGASRSADQPDAADVGADGLDVPAWVSAGTKPEAAG